MSRSAEPRRPPRPRRAISGILLLDKPPGLSSNAALQRVKGLYQADKAGHTGSLDPLATGVLPVCLGEATKLCGVLLESDKSYRARARLGARTATGDAEGAITETSAARPGRGELEAVLPEFLGTIRQVPPMYSALKRGGEPLYAIARRGEEVDRAAREVRIDRLDLVESDAEGFTLEVRCSKGTYIRTLVEDIARAAGACAHLTALRRTAVAPFEGQATLTLEALEQKLEAGALAALDACLLTPAQGLAHWPRVTVSPADAARLARGQAVRWPDAPAPGRCAVLDERGALLGLAESLPDGGIAPRRWLQPGTVTL